MSLRALLPYFLLVASQLCFASNHILGRLVEGVVPPIGLSFWRWVGGALILLPFTWTTLAASWPVIRARWRMLTLLAVTLVPLGNTTIYLGLNYTTAINASVIAVAQPAVTFVLSWLIYRDTITRGQAAGAAIAMVGVLTVVSRGDPALLAQFELNIGDLFILVSGVGFALYAIFLRNAPKELPPLAMLVVLQIMGAIILAPLYAWESVYVRPLRLDGPTLVAVLWAAVVVAILAMWLWNAGIRAIGANTASVYVYVRLFFVTIGAILILGETIHLYHLVAFILVFAGIWLVSRGGLKAPKTAEKTASKTV
jgi:drug/metabolite transporter (DMT)-like permease